MQIELLFLKIEFEKNQYPSKTDKASILKVLGKEFKSTIDMNQLNRWFQVYHFYYLYLMILASKREINKSWK